MAKTSRASKPAKKTTAKQPASAPAAPAPRKGAKTSATATKAAPRTGAPASSRGSKNAASPETAASKKVTKKTAASEAPAAKKASKKSTTSEAPASKKTSKKSTASEAPAAKKTSKKSTASEAPASKKTSKKQAASTEAPASKKTSKKTATSDDIATAKKASKKQAAATEAPASKKASKKTATSDDAAAPKKASKKRSAAEAPASQQLAFPMDIEAPKATSASAGPLQPGDRVPDFSLEADDGQTYSRQSLAGERFVIYFYPKDDTPGCTRQACGFRDSRPQFDAASVKVLGVSGDSLKSHGRFRSKYELNFPLLADPERTVAQAFGAVGEKKLYGKTSVGIIRSTFVVGPDGIVEKTFSPVKVDGHAEAVLQALAPA